MKYFITENRIIGLIDSFMKDSVPNFSRDNVLISKQIFHHGNRKYNRIDYLEPNTEEILAKYYLSTGELLLNRILFENLEGMFGNKMDYIIDWFNQEFNQHAEYVSFF